MWRPTRLLDFLTLDWNRYFPPLVDNIGLAEEAAYFLSLLTKSYIKEALI